MAISWRPSLAAVACAGVRAADSIRLGDRHVFCPIGRLASHPEALRCSDSPRQNRRIIQYGSKYTFVLSHSSSPLRHLFRFHAPCSFVAA